MCGDGGSRRREIREHLPPPPLKYGDFFPIFVQRWIHRADKKKTAPQTNKQKKKNHATRCARTIRDLANKKLFYCRFLPPSSALPDSELETLSFSLSSHSPSYPEDGSGDSSSRTEREREREKKKVNYRVAETVCAAEKERKGKKKGKRNSGIGGGKVQSKLGKSRGQLKKNSFKTTQKIKTQVKKKGGKLGGRLPTTQPTAHS